MNTSYADAVRARGEARQSPPRGNTDAPHLIAPVDAMPIRSGDRNPDAAATNSTSTASCLTSQGQELAPNINPTKPEVGESLPAGYARNYAGFLIQTRRRRIHVSEDLVAAEERFLQDHLIVASFIGGRPSAAGFKTWLTQLNSQITGGSISYSGDLGWDFTCLKASSQDVARQTLVLTPCRLGSFLCIFQQWTPLFDPSSSRGMFIPTWITLKKLPLQFFGVAHEIAASLGKVLGKDSQNCHFKDPRFCIALDTSKGWETELEIEDRLSGKLITILVDYTNLPIRCRYCHDLNHQVRDCPQRNNNSRLPKQAESSLPTKSSCQQPSGAPIQMNCNPTTDAEGFTTVQRRSQHTLRGPPDFRILQEAEQLVTANATPPTSSLPRDTPQAAPPSSPHQQVQSTPVEEHLNHPSATHGHQALTNSHETANAASLTPQVLPHLRSFIRHGPNLVGYDTSHGSPHRSGGSPPGDDSQNQMSVDPAQTLRLHFPTHHLDEPTQPFLSLDLDLNAAVDRDENYRSSFGGVNSSPLSARSSSCHRSRSRSRSPSRGKVVPAFSRRNSSPNSNTRLLRASPPGTGLLHSS